MKQYVSDDVRAMSMWSPNNTLDPSQVTQGSSRTSALWLCDLGHEFSGSPAKVVRKKRGCPVCAGKIVLPGFNDLATKRPDVAALWSPKNPLTAQGVMSSSQKKADFVCSLGHEWNSVIASVRACPYCTGAKIWPGFNDLATLYPDIAKQYSDKNPIPASQEFPGANRSVWWKGDCGHEWKATPYRRTRDGQGCVFCTGKSVLLGFNDLASKRPHLAKEWSHRNSRSPEEFSEYSNFRPWWICEKGHQWQTGIDSRAKLLTGCPYCSGRNVISGENDIATLYPKLAEQWSYKNKQKPEEVASKSGKKAIWQCSLGHEWEAVVCSRTTKSVGCPYCANCKVLPGFNDMATTHPDISKQLLDPGQATTLTYGSERKVYWKCPIGHEYESTVSKKTGRGDGCPKCATKVSRGEQEVFDFVHSLGVNPIQSDRILIGPKELDIYIPTANIAIEYNGLYWHSEQFQGRWSHYEKWKACRDVGVQLITLWEDQWIYNRDVVEGMLRSKITGRKTIGGRKFNVDFITYAQASEFINKTHIQGKASGTWYVGLFSKDTNEISSVGVFKKTSTHIELVRYSSLVGIQGGTDKMMKALPCDLPFVTFADHSVSAGGMYETGGWTHDKEIPPDYMYIDGDERQHKFNYRKSRIKASPYFEYIEGMTETQLAEINGLERIYDCGKTRYVRDSIVAKTS